MASEIGNPSSVTPSSLQSNSKSGQQAAPLLSGVPEEQQVTAGASIRDGDRVEHASHRSNQPPSMWKMRYKNCRNSANYKDGQLALV